VLVGRLIVFACIAASACGSVAIDRKEKQIGSKVITD
jgi:hypothetical protein